MEIRASLINHPVLLFKRQTSEWVDWTWANMKPNCLQLLTLHHTYLSHLEVGNSMVLLEFLWVAYRLDMFITSQCIQLRLGMVKMTSLCTGFCWKNLLCSLEARKWDHWHHYRRTGDEGQTRPGCLTIKIWSLIPLQCTRIWLLHVVRLDHVSKL